MTVPVIAICGIASDEASWLCMPVDRIVVPRGATIDAMAETIIADLPDRVALCGHSMGGYVALAIAARVPDRLAGFAMLSSACTADSDTQGEGRRQAIEQAEADYGAVVDRLARAVLSRSSRADTALLADVHAMLLRAGAARFVEHQRAAATRVDRCGLLATITVPALVLAGEEDGIVLPDRSREMAAALPDAVLYMIPGCGHMPQREAPDITRSALTAWRARLAGRSSSA
jgi:pimeloyl-ACP methyl ester carboxylesterase